MTLEAFLAAQQKVIETTLDRLVPPEAEHPQTIHKAMRYSLFAGGKRIRPFFASRPRTPRPIRRPVSNRRPARWS